MGNLNFLRTQHIRIRPHPAALKKAFCNYQWPVIPSQCSRTSNEEQEREGKLLSMMIWTGMWNLKAIGEFGSDFRAFSFSGLNRLGLLRARAQPSERI